MRFFLSYFRQRAIPTVLYFVFAAVFAVVFVLYDLPFKAVLYPYLICLFIGAVVVAIDCLRIYKKHKTYNEQKDFPAAVMTFPDSAADVTENDLLAVIAELRTQISREIARNDARFKETNEYYSLWAHQIKTPIASMYLMLGNCDTAQSRRLMSELTRIERYVDMAMSYLKLDSEATDFVFRKHSLDSLLKTSIKSFSTEFILRKLTLDYSEINKRIVTDEKWFCFVVEQLLSNALKYTENGGIKIYMKNESVLCIEDTGIGIAPEDLPRIFEHGFTGENGRTDKKASGIGLYLCRRICGRLGIGLSAESTPDVGTKVYLDLSQYDLRVE